MMERISETSHGPKPEPQALLIAQHRNRSTRPLCNRQIGCCSQPPAAMLYIAVTQLFYDIFRRTNRGPSLFAVFSSLVGCALGALAVFHLAAPQINNQSLQELWF